MTETNDLRISSACTREAGTEFGDTPALLLHSLRNPTGLFATQRPSGFSSYSEELVDSMRGQVEKKIVFAQSLLKDIILWDELNHFSNSSVFDRGFVENELAIWLNPSTDYEVSKRIGWRLSGIPFEQAYCYKNPEFYTKSRGDIFKEVFNDDSFEWRTAPHVAFLGTIQQKMRVIKRFEYMCYYVINTRDELLFDIQCNLNPSV